MKKKHIVVLMGGVSSEHEISLKTGANVAESLDRRRYRVTPVVISKKGRWRFSGENAMPIHEAVLQLCRSRVDCIFLALHGPFGEDGRIQGMLDLLGIPYIGSGCIASGIAMDKIRCKALVQNAGIRVAKQIVLRSADWRSGHKKALDEVEARLGFPCVVKSPCQGSSLGMAIPRNRKAFQTAMPALLELDEQVLVEEYLSGTEVTSSVLDVEPGNPPRALPITEICPVTSPFFDYEAKYKPGACIEITPARISEAATRRVQEIGIRVHTLVGCSGLSRSDMILVGDEPVWLEVNTIPGFTETSLFPQAAKAVGISFLELAGMLVEAAIARKKRKSYGD